MMAASIVGEPPSGLRVEANDLDLTRTIGNSPPGSVVTGDGQSILQTLWGRHPEGARVEGDQQVADAWLSLVSRAFVRPKNLAEPTDEV